MAVDDVAVLRAYALYLRQVRLGYSRVFVEAALEEHPAVARLLADLFVARFDPANTDRANVADIDLALEETIGAIESLDQDRVLRRFKNLILATVRTSWAQRDADGAPRPYLAFKFDPTAMEEIPEPRPRHEIFVSSPRFEGVHLRAGPVARSGLLYRGRTARAVAIEFALGLAALWLSGWFATSSLLSGSLALWSYFLVQSAYFPLSRALPRRSEQTGDAFDAARTLGQVENFLESR